MFENIAKKIIAELAKNDIEAYIWHAATTGSVYIRFGDQRMGSLRLGDHPGRSKLKYKYNLRSDISNKHKRWLKDKGTWRFYLQLNSWKEIIPVLVDRAKTVKTWPKAKYNYTIPHFKRKQS